MFSLLVVQRFLSASNSTLKLLVRDSLHLRAILTSPTPSQIYSTPLAPQRQSSIEQTYVCLFLSEHRATVLSLVKAPNQKVVGVPADLKSKRLMDLVLALAVMHIMSLDHFGKCVSLMLSNTLTWAANTSNHLWLSSNNALTIQRA